jgi:hypothetical protein
MPCVACGSETKAGTLLCARCAARIDDPFSLVPCSQDPMADARLFQTGSAAIRVFPSPSEDLALSRGPGPALRLRAMLSREDKRPVQTLVDEYLAGMGVDLHVWGDERLPRRAFLPSLLDGAGPLDFKTETWARASIRMGNLHALLVRHVSILPIDDSWRRPFVDSNAETARALYARARSYGSLSSVVSSDRALLDHWTGRSVEALSALAALTRSESVDADVVAALVKQALVFVDLGKNDEALDALAKVPGAMLDRRAAALRRSLEGRP